MPLNIPYDQEYYTKLTEQVRQELKRIPNLATLAVIYVKVVEQLVETIELREKTTVDSPLASLLPAHIHTLELILCSVHRERDRLLKEADVRSLQKPTK